MMPYITGPIPGYKLVRFIIFSTEENELAFVWVQVMPLKHSLFQVKNFLMMLSLSL